MEASFPWHWAHTVWAISIPGERHRTGYALGVEGKVNKLKLIKSMGYGRAAFALPHQCVLHALLHDRPV